MFRASSWLNRTIINHPKVFAMSKYFDGCDRIIKFGMRNAAFLIANYAVHQNQIIICALRHNNGASIESSVSSPAIAAMITVVRNRKARNLAVKRQTNIHARAGRNA